MTGPGVAAATRGLRWWRVGGAAVSVALVLLAAGGDQRPVVAAEEEASPQAVVWQYLRALGAGDARTALGYADAVPILEGSQDLLVPQALSGGWTATRVVTRHQDAETAIVDVTLAATDGTAQEGRFALAHSDRGGWRILNPMVKVDFGRLPMRYVELNGVTTSSRVVWLFPGVYRAYGASGLLRVGAPTYVAVPTMPVATLDGPEASLRRYLPTVELTDAGVEELHDQLRDWIDRCAATGQPFPAGGCPFAAGNPDDDTIYALDGDYQADGASVTWQVLTYPRVRLVQTDGGLTGQLMVPGRLQLSGTARPRYSEDGSGLENFTSRCTVWLKDLSVTLPNPDTFRFVIELDTTGLACGRAQFYD